MIEYFLQPYKLPTMLGKFRGRVKMNRAIDQEKLLNYVSQEVGTTVTYSDTVAVINIFMQGIAHFLLNGHAVNLDLFNARLGLKGYFENEDEAYDPSKHTLCLNINSGKKLKRVIDKKVKLIRVYKDEPQPKLRRIFDFKSKTRTANLTPGGVARVRGEELNFDKANPNEGLYIIDNTGAETKVNNDDIQTLTNLVLMFQIPDTLTPGDYTLEIRKTFGTELRAGVTKALTVV